MPTSIPRGFTLIEILVVAAIISLLSGIVLAALQETRLRAADASIKEQVQALRHVMELEFSASGSYTAIKSGGGGTGTSGFKVYGDQCSSGFTGQHAADAQRICRAIIRSQGASCGTQCLKFDTVAVPGYGLPPANNLADRFSIMAYLPYESSRAGTVRYMCLGSSGKITTTATPSPWDEPGCTNDP